MVFEFQTFIMKKRMTGFEINFRIRHWSSTERDNQIKVVEHKIAPGGLKIPGSLRGICLEHHAFYPEL